MAINARGCGRQARLLVGLCLALFAPPSCARQQMDRLVKAPLLERCETARRAAKFSFRFDPRIAPESIPDGFCAQTLATVSGKRLLRVAVEWENPPRETPLFREGESCSWPDLHLVGLSFAGMDRSIKDVVILVFLPEKARGIPFEVGVVSRSLEEDNLPLMSPCGVMPGIMRWRKGDWQLEADLERDRAE